MAGAVQAGRPQFIPFMSLPWSQSGHLLSLAPPPMAEAMDIFVAISIAWTADMLMLAANTTAKIEVSVRRSQARVMPRSMGRYFQTASPIRSRGCDFVTRAGAMWVSFRAYWRLARHYALRRYLISAAMPKIRPAASKTPSTAMPLCIQLIPPVMQSITLLLYEEHRARP
jgi:hypothetical protein